MFQGRKPFFHWQADESQNKDETQVEVSNDCPAHESSSLILTMDTG
jgi:hypothetical protein